MKKIITVVSIMLIALSASSQNKKANRSNNDCYLQTAATTFNLSEDNKVKLSNLLTEKLEERTSIIKKIKTSEVSKEEGKTQLRALNQTYFKNLAALTGKSKKEIMSFEKETKDNCKKK